MGNLYRNELFKIWKQKSFRVTAIIVAAIIVALPILSFGINKIIDSTSSLYDTEEYEEMAEDAREGGDELGYYYWTSYIEANKFFVDNNITDRDWKYSQYHSDYLEYCFAKNAYIFALNNEFNQEDPYRLYDLGKYLFDFNENLFNLVPEKLDPDLVEEYNEWYDYYHNMNYSEGEEPEFDKEKFLNPLVSYEEALKAVEAAIADYEKEILEATSEKIIQQELDNVRDQITFLKSSLDEINSTIEQKEKTAKTDEEIMEVEALVQESKQLDVQIQETPKLIECYEYIIKNKLDINSWQYVTLSLIESQIYDEYASIPSGEKTYEAYYSYSGDNYKLYCEEKQNAADLAKEAIDEFVFSIKTDSAVSGLVPNSAKAQWKEILQTSIFLIGIISIVIAGTTIANEHSSGTIRLLLARPQSRSKILTAKLLATLTFSAAMMLIAFLSSYLEIILLTGGNDIFMYEIIMVGGEAVGIDPFIAIFGKFIAWMIVPLMITMFAFLLSALTKKAPLSLIFSFIIFSQTSSISMIALSVYTLSPKMHFLKYLIFPYLEMTPFTTTSAEYVISREELSFDISSIINLISGLTYPETRGMLPWVGVATILLMTALFIFLSYVSFNKKEIKD